MIEQGSYDEHGHWKPPYSLSYSPAFERPLKVSALLKYLFGWGGYLWPRHLFYAALATVTWFFLQPMVPAGAPLSLEWMGWMLLRNIAFLWFLFGGYHLMLYSLKLMGTKQKYHPKWQGKGKRFLFGDQTWDNIIRTTVSGGLVWTAYEVWYMWALSNRVLPLVNWTEQPLWFFGFFLLIPLWRETHFYFIHKLIHWKPLMKRIHYIHHLNYNPGPWAGMSMHTIEHILYLSVVLIHFVIPSHPIHFFYNAQLTALTPAQGHTGFEGPLFKGLLPVGDYFHYLHHKHVSCNFGGPTIPWDRWLGRFYNGEGPYSTAQGKT